MLVSSADIAELETKAIALAEVAAAGAAPEKEAVKVNEKARRLRELIGAHFSGGHRKAIAHIVSTLIDEPLAAVLPQGSEGEDGHRIIEGFTLYKEGSISGWLKCAPIVPTGNKNSHNYTLGEVAFGYEGDTCWRLHKNGQIDIGNHMCKSDWRPATVDEVRAAIAKFTPVPTGGIFS